MSLSESLKKFFQRRRSVILIDAGEFILNYPNKKIPENALSKHLKQKHYDRIKDILIKFPSLRYSLRGKYYERTNEHKLFEEIRAYTKHNTEYEHQRTVVALQYLAVYLSMFVILITAASLTLQTFISNREVAIETRAQLQGGTLFDIDNNGAYEYCVVNSGGAPSGKIFAYLINSTEEQIGSFVLENIGPHSMVCYDILISEIAPYINNTIRLYCQTCDPSPKTEKLFIEQSPATYYRSNTGLPEVLSTNTSNGTNNSRLFIKEENNASLITSYGKKP